MPETVKTNERWYKSENRLFHADKVTIKSTGEVVDISNSLEKLYAYMLNQYRYRKALKQPFAESQERLGTIARIGDPKKKTKSQIDKLIALGLVEITGKMGRCKIYTVTEVDKVAENLEFTYPEWDGEPTYDHEKRLGKSSQQPKNEEKKGDGESDQGGAEQRDGVSNISGSGNAPLSSDADAVNERYYADLGTLNNWVEGHDDEGFMAYGAMWGIAKPGAITDLIKSHIRIIQSDGYRGSRSAANDELSGADNLYKQQQAQRAAEAKQAVNAQTAQDYDEDLPF
ncbi:hypothetical protein MUA01_06280 [Enterobacteriaceae bacterium H18W14]|uniref:DUF6945 domain-containing protein n=1 Tax=Dryocola boscaweniae TaxID=2925397 RepID=UPI0022F0F67F|nr:hypothetical protein [Dryocola boscaweniae]MCT4714590.1 hypothetical protein [Dryocola boscaweniae]